MGTHRESLTSDITCLAYSLFFWKNVAFCPQRTHVWLLFVSLQFLLFYRCHCARHRSVTLASSLIHRHRLYILICYLPSFGWCVQPFFPPNIPHFFFLAGTLLLFSEYAMSIQHWMLSTTTTKIIFQIDIASKGKSELEMEWLAQIKIY